jgi:hypothetical protein
MFAWALRASSLSLLLFIITMHSCINIKNFTQVYRIMNLKKDNTDVVLTIDNEIEIEWANHAR